MSSAREELGTDIIDSIFDVDDMAETVTYTSKGESTDVVALAEIGDTGDSLHDPKSKNKGFGSAVFSIRCADLPDGPKAGDKITYHGATYTYVATLHIISGYMYRLQFATRETAVDWGFM